MRRKVIGLVISIMLLATFGTVAHPLQKTMTATQTNTPSSTSSMVDVPVWELGDTWTYKVNDITLDISAENQTMTLLLSIEQLPLVVTNTTGEYYTLSFTTAVNGQGIYLTDKGDGPVNISLSVTNMQLTGYVHIDKATLGIQDIRVSFEKEKLTLTINEQPYLRLPRFLQTLSVKFTSDIDIDSDESISPALVPPGHRDVLEPLRSKPLL
jgi:hypothetical protein